METRQQQRSKVWEESNTFNVNINEPGMCSANFKVYLLNANTIRVINTLLNYDWKYTAKEDVVLVDVRGIYTATDLKISARQIPYYGEEVLLS